MARAREAAKMTAHAVGVEVVWECLDHLQPYDGQPIAG
jgi:hypothetical protein